MLKEHFTSQREMFKKQQIPTLLTQPADRNWTNRRHFSFGAKFSSSYKKSIFSAKNKL